jgi:hypothetical protein
MSEQVLRRSRGSTPLPVPVRLPLVACSLGELLHLVATEPEADRAVHLMLDADGQLVGRPNPVPLRFGEAIVACNGELLVSGESIDGGVSSTVRISADGEVRGEFRLEAPESLSVWPRPYCAGGSPGLAWEAGEYAASLYWTGLAAISAPPLYLPLEDTSAELVILGASGGPAFLRVHGPGSLTILRPTSSGYESVDLEAGHASSIAVATVGDSAAALWVERGQALMLQWLDRTRHPNGAPVRLISVEGPARLQSARLLGGASDRLAIGYRADALVDESGSPVDDGTHTVGQPRRATEHFIAAADGRTREVGPFQRVEPPGTTFDAGGWVAGRLVLVHGGVEPAVSVFATDTRPGVEA